MGAKQFSLSSRLILLACLVFDLAVITAFFAFFGWFTLLDPVKSMLMFLVLVLGLLLVNGAIALPNLLFKTIGVAYSTFKAVNYSTVRNHLKEYMDRVAEDYETYIITRKNEKNIVMMSAEEYDNLMENFHLLGHEPSRNSLSESKKQLEAGHVVNSVLLEEE